MSYILDALKRADAERDRGAVPGLHTPPIPVSAARKSHSQFWQLVRPMLLLTGIVVLLASCWLLWRWHHQTSPESAVATVNPALPAAVINTPLQSTATAAGLASSSPAPVTASPPPRASSLPLVAKAASNRPASIDKIALPEKPIATPATAPTGTPVMSISQLPADIGQSLPKLTISGSTYSKNPAYRMVILNGQVFHEGDKPATDLTLEQITTKSVIFNFKGYRYAMPS